MRQWRQSEVRVCSLLVVAGLVVRMRARGWCEDAGEGGAVHELMREREPG